MIEFGIPVLDAEFKGISDIRILAEGVPGCGKEVLAYHLINKALERGEVCIVVTASQSHEDVQSGLRYYKMRTAPIFWIETVEEFQGKEGVISASLGEFFTISSSIKGLIEKHKGEKITIVMDAISPALMCNDPKVVYEGCRGIMNLAKKEGVTAYVLVEQDMHDPKQVVAFEQLTDGVFSFVVKEVEEGRIKRGILIKKKAGRPTPENVFVFKLTEKGLEIEAGPK